MYWACQKSDGLAKANCPLKTSSGVEKRKTILKVSEVLSKKAQKCLISYNPLSSRIISARFSATPFNISIIHVYAPTTDASDEEIESFYGEIENALRETPKKD